MTPWGASQNEVNTYLTLPEKTGPFFSFLQAISIAYSQIIQKKGKDTQEIGCYFWPLRMGLKSIFTRAYIKFKTMMDGTANK